MAAARAEQKAAAEATEASACNRRTRRKATALPGLLMFKGMRMQVACTIADMSVTGARITISEVTAKTFGDMEHLPDKAILVMRADHMQVDCEVKWRKPGSIGLRFLGPPVALAKPRR
jgi:hypothetical protein